MDSLSSVSGSYQTSAATSSAKATSTSAGSETAAKAGAFSDKAAVYERSSGTVGAKNANVDRSALVKQMQADLDTRMNQLTDIVRQSISQQGATLGKADDIWSFLASGKFQNVDEAAVAQAKEDISENGYWGVDQTSSRIVDFAIALSGNDPDKADKMISAFKKGYDEATKAWGKQLPEISSNTYDAVMDKFDQWKNGTYQSSVE